MYLASLNKVWGRQACIGRHKVLTIFFEQVAGLLVNDARWWILYRHEELYVFPLNEGLVLSLYHVLGLDR